MNRAHSITKRIFIGTAAFALCLPAVAQNPQLQEKLAAVKAVAAENKQQLHQYQWTETIQLTLKGDAKEPQNSLCQYGPDGQIQKTPIGPPPQEPSGGRLKQRIIEKKKAEIKGYMGQVKGLLSLYVPPDAQRMQDAYAAGNFALNPTPGAMNLVFTNYAQPGDRMTIKFDTAAKKIISVDVNTYLDEAKDAVTLHVIMATLPNGPNYAQQTVINAKAKSLVVTTTNSNYQKL
ncbi:MAG: hypothetical protein WAM58_17400 [Candidatus Acidiferrum sp.]